MKIDKVLYGKIIFPDDLNIFKNYESLSIRAQKSLENKDLKEWKKVIDEGWNPLKCSAVFGKLKALSLLTSSKESAEMWLSVFPEYIWEIRPQRYFNGWFESDNVLTKSKKEFKQWIIPLLPKNFIDFTVLSNIEKEKDTEGYLLDTFDAITGLNECDSWGGAKLNFLSEFMQSPCYKDIRSSKQKSSILFLYLVKAIARNCVSKYPLDENVLSFSKKTFFEGGVEISEDIKWDLVAIMLAGIAKDDAKLLEFGNTFLNRIINWDNEILLFKNKFENKTEWIKECVTKRNRLIKPLKEWTSTFSYSGIKEEIKSNKGELRNGFINEAKNFAKDYMFVNKKINESNFCWIFSIFSWKKKNCIKYLIDHDLVKSENIDVVNLGSYSLIENKEGLLKIKNKAIENVNSLLIDNKQKQEKINKIECNFKERLQKSKTIEELELIFCDKENIYSQKVRVKQKAALDKFKKEKSISWILEQSFGFWDLAILSGANPKDVYNVFKRDSFCLNYLNDYLKKIEELNIKDWRTNYWTDEDWISIQESQLLSVIPKQKESIKKFKI